MLLFSVHRRYVLYCMERVLPMNEKKELQQMRFAVKQTIPVMMGYLFLGIAFGLMLQNAGYHFLWAFAISLFVYAGSMQFVMVSLLSGGASLIYAAVMTFFINGRHIFYGLSFIEKFNEMGKWKPYMIFSLTDETYSVLCGVKVPEGMSEKKTMFYISFFDQCYWIIGSVIGGLAGQLITFNTTGIDFSMTALFIAIVIEQWQESRNRAPAIIGTVCAVLCLLLLGPDRFIVPALAASVAILLVLQPMITKEEKAKQEEKEGEVLS